MNTQHVTLTIGISASGKTTKANEIINSNKSNPSGYINVNRDDLRFSLFGFTSWADYKFSKTREAFITKSQFDTATLAISLGMNVIVSDTNLSKKTRDKWKAFCKDQGVDYRELIVDTPVEECQKRNAVRANGIDPSVIYDQHKRFLEQFGDKYIGNPDLPKAIIVDIDGTLAHMDGKRGPYSWDKVYEDRLDEEVAMFLGYAIADHEIIILSGRDGICRKLTYGWLCDKGVCFNELFMREAGDNRPDTVIKRELFDNNIKGNYNVKLCIDDRPCMVNMWNDMGIKTWAVADQRIKF